MPPFADTPSSLLQDNTTPFFAETRRAFRHAEHADLRSAAISRRHFLSRFRQQDWPLQHHHFTENQCHFSFATPALASTCPRQRRRCRQPVAKHHRCRIRPPPPRARCRRRRSRARHACRPFLPSMSLRRRSAASVILMRAICPRDKMPENTFASSSRSASRWFRAPSPQPIRA